MQIKFTNRSGPKSKIIVHNPVNTVGFTNKPTHVVVHNNGTPAVGTETSRISVTNNNKVGRVTFAKVSVIPPQIGLRNLYDVNISNQQNTDVLVYNSNTDTYIMEPLPDVDGGTF